MGNQGNACIWTGCLLELVVLLLFLVFMVKLRSSIFSFLENPNGQGGRAMKRGEFVKKRVEKGMEVRIEGE